MKLKRSTRATLVAFAFVFPCVLILAATMATPIFNTFQFSFSKVKLPSLTTSFIGMKNYTDFLSRPDVAQVALNTLLWTVGVVILRFGIGLWAATVVNISMKGMIVWQTLLLVPWTIPSIVAGNLWRWILQGDFGLLRSTLQALGLRDAPLWLSDPSWAMPSVMIAYTWSGFSFVMILLLAGMKAIPEEQYEAARLDGCTNGQLFRHITLPGIRSVVVIVLILETINGLNSFDLLYVMTGGGPGGATTILGILIYQLGFSSFDFGVASAASVTLLAIVVAGFLVYVPAAARRRGGV